MLTKYISA
jgi:hypothetical protein